MPQIWRPRPIRPPRPFVEDELESLSHELGGLSLLGEKPGVEGACERGTIDQIPILLDNEHLPRSATADTDNSTSQPPSLISESSNESFGPRTPSPVQAVPLSGRIKQDQATGFDVPASYFDSYTKPTSLEHPIIVQAGNPHSQPSSPGSNAQTPQPHHVTSSPSEGEVTPTRNTNLSITSLQTTSGVRRLENSSSLKRPTIAELLEEKLRLRREQQALDQHTDGQYRDNTHGQTRMPSSAPAPPKGNVHINVDAVQYISQPSSPHRSYEILPSNTSRDWDEYDSSLRSPTRHSQESSYFEMNPTQRGTPPPRRPNYERTTSTRPRRAVSFADSPHYSPTELPETTRASYCQSSDISSTISSLEVVPIKRVVISRAPDPSASLALRPCPRSHPVAGYRDWYTISGLEYLNICPSCMAQLRNSKFREYFIPNVNNTRARTRCSFSEAWTRLAWIQTIKKGHDNLELLYEITRPTGLTCPGRRLSTQVWHRIIDHDTGLDVPKFAACTACVRNLRLLMPPLRQTFRRQTVVQEKICDLAVDSPRFVQYIDLLDAAANHCEYKKYDYPDNHKFIDYFQRKCNLRDCRRQRSILGTWHYIPELPEFTVCEDCYDDVVRPLAAARMPIARRLATPPRLVPGSGPNRCREASCQLYSPRMRAKFRDAVLDNNYRMLEAAALKRFDTEQRYRDREEELLLVPEADRGYHWEEEWRYNLEQWRVCE